MKFDLIGKNINELTEFMYEIQEKPFRAKQLFKWLYANKIANLNHASSLSRDIIKRIGEKAFISVPKIVKKEITANNDTAKYLIKLSDGELIESVIMRYEEDQSIGRITACISTQIGCKYGCRFCLSGKEGFVRDLTVSEIINQILVIQRDINSENDRISNIVFMGIGEPLDNYDNLISSIKIISNSDGISISSRKISVSTCGLADKISELADEDLNIRLAVSLHSADESKRNDIMPVNRKYNLKTLKRSLLDFQKKNGLKMIFEYALIKDFNDTDEDANKLADYLKDFKCVLNIIPLNETKMINKISPEDNEIFDFAHKLIKKGIIVTIRKSRGTGINAACGQLKNYHKNILNQC